GDEERVTMGELSKDEVSRALEHLADDLPATTVELRDHIAALEARAVEADLALAAALERALARAVEAERRAGVLECTVGELRGSIEVGGGALAAALERA